MLVVVMSVVVSPSLRAGKRRRGDEYCERSGKQ
jgi:hypothetical protein